MLAVQQEYPFHYFENSIEEHCLTSSSFSRLSQILPDILSPRIRTDAFLSFWDIRQKPNSSHQSNNRFGQILFSRFINQLYIRSGIMEAVVVAGAAALCCGSLLALWPMVGIPFGFFGLTIGCSHRRGGRHRLRRNVFIVIRYSGMIWLVGQ